MRPQSARHRRIPLMNNRRDCDRFNTNRAIRWFLIKFRSRWLRRPLAGRCLTAQVSALAPVTGGTRDDAVVMTMSGRGTLLPDSPGVPVLRCSWWSGGERLYAREGATLGAQMTWGRRSAQDRPRRRRLGGFSGRREEVARAREDPGFPDDHEQRTEA